MFFDPHPWDLAIVLIVLIGYLGKSSVTGKAILRELSQ